MTAEALAGRQLQQACAAAGLPWQAHWHEIFAAVCRAVAEGARQTNLVGDASAAGVAEHWMEALTVVAAAADAGVVPRTVADIGAGAGIAAMAYRCAWPDAEVFAVEPRRLRAEFIARAAEQVFGAARLQVVQGSLHAALATGRLPAQIDLADARAVWPPDEWLAKGLPLVGALGAVAIHAKAVPLLPARSVLAAQRAVPGDRGNWIAIVRPRAFAAT